MPAWYTCLNSLVPKVRSIASPENLLEVWSLSFLPYKVNVFVCIARVSLETNMEAPLYELNQHHRYVGEIYC